MSGMQLKRLTIPLCDILRTDLSTSFLKSNNIQLENKGKDREIKRNLRKRIVIRKDREIKIKRNLQKRDEETEYEKSSSGDEETEYEKSSSGATKLSLYEKLIEKNRAEKMAFLETLRMDEVKANLAEVVEKTKKKRPCIRKLKIEISPAVLRKSRRLNSNSINFSERFLYRIAIETAKKEFEASKKEQIKKKIPPKMSFVNAMPSEEFYESYARDVNIRGSNSETNFFLYDKSVLNKMTVSKSHIATTPYVSTNLAWYPSAEKLIVTAGDRHGNIDIWNVDSDSKPYQFKCHYRSITSLQFSPFFPTELCSSSCDGTLRCGDMVQHIFSKIYHVSDATSCTYFDFVSPSTYLVAQRNGEIVLVDRRSKPTCFAVSHTCHEYPVKTVNVHPVNKDFFLTADKSGSIRLWDLRKLEETPIIDIKNYSERHSGVNSAFFSPVTGHSILAASAGVSISIFDIKNLTENVKLKKLMRYGKEYHKRSEPLKSFRVQWLPNSEEAFLIGNTEYPVQLKVYDKRMLLYSVMKNDSITSQPYSSVFHPMRPALACGIRSKKIVVFT